MRGYGPKAMSILYNLSRQQNQQRRGVSDRSRTCKGLKCSHLEPGLSEEEPGGSTPPPPLGGQAAVGAGAALSGPVLCAEANRDSVPMVDTIAVRDHLPSIVREDF